MAGSTSATVNISQPAPLEKKGELGENWNKWKQNFKIYLIASGIKETDRTACALFLHTIGQHGRDIYNELELGDIDDVSMEDLYKRFDQHCNPKNNLAFTRYQFFNTKQGKQTFDVFLLALKQKSKNCEFGDLNNSLMMTQIIAGISNKKLQERLFLLNDLDLEKTIQECRATELAELHVQQIPGGVSAKKKAQKATSNVKENTAAETRNRPPRKAPSQQNQPNNTSDNKSKGNSDKSGNQKKVISCRMCGTTHLYGSCPAFGTTCKLCEKPNHFASVCKNK